MQSSRIVTLSLLVAAASTFGATRADAQAPDGKKIFATTCAACHMPGGEGQEGKIPPLAGSEWVADDGKVLRIVLHGLTGPVEVAGEPFDGAMPGWGPVLKDADIAAVATYVRSSWGNKAGPLTTEKVAAMRAAYPGRVAPWTVAELSKVIQVKK